MQQKYFDKLNSILHFVNKNMSLSRSCFTFSQYLLFVYSSTDDGLKNSAMFASSCPASVFVLFEAAYLRHAL